MRASTGILPYDAKTAIEPVLADALMNLRDRGLSVAGLIQRAGPRLPGGKRAMWVEDIESGNAIRLDKPRGPGAKGCVLDPAALADAACLLARASARRPDVILVNRFGQAEAEGGGMRAEIGDAICSGAAVLIPVRMSLLGALLAFLGDDASELPPCAPTIADWAERAARFQPAAP